MDTAFVLHRRRYRETSLIVDFLSRDRGRVSAVARGALRRNSRLGQALQPASLLRVTFTGRSELLTLTGAETEGAAATFGGNALYSLFYVNELVLKLTAAHDQNLPLFDAYARTLAALAAGEPLEPVLRRFEKQMLDALGLGLNLATVADTGRPIEADVEYRYAIEDGALAGGQTNAPRVHGRTLLALAGEGTMAAAELREAKKLMRHVLGHHLEGRTLASRQLFEPARARRPATD